MKRALAERAKQSASIGASEPPHPYSSAPTHQPTAQEPSNVGTSSPAPVPSSLLISHAKNSDSYQHPQQSPSQPPKKIAKVDTTIWIASDGGNRSVDVPPKPDIAPSSASNLEPLPSIPSSGLPLTLPAPATVPSRSASVGGAGHKRPRDPAPPAGGADPSSSSTNAFYLQHQNRALAVELRSLQHSLKSLEREREQRRKDCWSAVQSLHTLHATWTQLETALLDTGTSTATTTTTTTTTTTSSSSINPENSGSNSSAAASIPVPSTGAGDTVEWTVALSNALAALGSNGGDVGEGGPESNYYAACDRIATSLAARASALQELLWSLLHEAPTGEESSHVTASATAARTEFADQRRKVQEAMGEIQHLQAQIDELKASRNAAVASERKVRRNVYRLAANMINVDQLMAAIQDDNETIDAGLQQEIVKQQLLKQDQGQVSGAAASNASGDPGRPIGEGGPAADADSLAKHAHASAATIDAMQTRITDLERALSNRDDSIEQLTKQLGEKEQRVTELLITQRSESDVAKLQGWDGLSKRLEVLEAAKAGLESKLAEARDNWAQSRGDREAAIQSMEEQHVKFNKRWAELVQGFAPGSSAGDNGDDDYDALLGEHAEAQAKEVVQLQHKLSQALENVRQAESSRQALKDALAMNDSLQSKLDEIKAKYCALRNLTNAAAQKGTASGDGNAVEVQHHNSGASTIESSSKDAGVSSKETPSINKETAPSSSKEVHAKEGGQSNSHGGTSNSAAADGKLEKLHKEHRRMRKEISAAVASKEAAKAKLEKVEKERDSLMESNFRLLKQMTEKDDMNAKSLSTILHLKSMSEELMKERDSLEQQAKSASQLALTARLASNAKDRVSEEIVKEKEALEAKVEELESTLAESKRRLDSIAVEFAGANGKTSTIRSELSNALSRCQELVGELEAKNAEIRALTDTVSKSERETRDLTGKLQKLMKNPAGGGASSGGGDSSSSTSAFTVDQLNTQISVLKGRLACPVCHYRDKECIIMRCRHMHCKQCVDERISNRSRKCPTCNNKFSEKDVEDVWLN